MKRGKTPARRSLARCKYGLSTKTLAWIFANAAAWLEKNPNSDADLAISNVTEHLSFKVRSTARMEFRDEFGCWIGDDDGVLMLCFASAAYATGDA